MLGVREGQRAEFTDAAVKIDSVQAMLAFNRLEDERYWKNLLEKKCFAQAARALDVARDKDTELLAEFLRGKLDRGIVKYINDRDPALIGELRTFKSRYGNSWTEEDCGR